jgi:hypothetical protein
MSAASGISVTTMTHCHIEATTQVEATYARHGPKGTAARLSTDPSDETKLAVTFTISGICRTASSIIFKGGRRPDARKSDLPRPSKRLPLVRSNTMRTTCKNVPISRRGLTGGYPFMGGNLSD